GRGSASWTLGAQPGTQSVRATSGALAPADFTATANATYTLTWFKPADNAVVGDSVYILVRGNSTQLVRATAADGDSAVARRTIILDRFPVLTATGLEGAVARPGLRVDADCTDDAGPCTMSVYIDQGTPFVSQPSGVHT